MSTVVDQLVDMGFERARAEYAFAKTGKGALEAAMDWLISHEGEEIPAHLEDSILMEEGKAAESSSELTESTPGSYKCNEAIAEERRRAKQEEAEARQRVLDQIKADRLSAVRLWLELNHSDGSPFTLLQPFPRKLMTDEDYEKPLKELGLVPSANFVMTRYISQTERMLTEFDETCASVFS
ncbi:hypothetical protein RB195_006903 [Necator americanus]|uniref:UBA/TS-N domain protein n=1 Tax=Necator americanus TaxID=51031 RepID=A0ABR1BW37_NECAM